MSTEPTCQTAGCGVPQTRREFLATNAFGIGSFALASLLSEQGLLAAETISKPGENLPQDLKARQPHHTARANAMISLFMHGGPSHVDLLDPKTELSRLSGTE